MLSFELGGNLGSLFFCLGWWDYECLVGLLIIIYLLGIGFSLSLGF